MAFAGLVILGLVLTISHNESRRQRLLERGSLPSRVMLGPPPSQDVPILGTHCCTTEYGLEASTMAAQATNSAAWSMGHGKHSRAPPSLEARLFREAVADADSTGAGGNQGLSGVVYLVVTPRRTEDALEQLLRRLHEHFLRLHRYPVVVYLASGNLTQDSRDHLQATVPSSIVEFRPVPGLLEQHQAAQAQRSSGTERKPAILRPEAAEYERALWDFQVSEAPRLLAQEFEWILHLSEDTLLSQDVLLDPFHALRMTDRRLGYMAAHRAVDEEGLWAFGRKFAEQHVLARKGKGEAALHLTWNVPKAIDARWIAYHKSVFTSELYRLMVVALAASPLTDTLPASTPSPTNPPKDASLSRLSQGRGPPLSLPSALFDAGDVLLDPSVAAIAAAVSSSSRTSPSSRIQSEVAPGRYRKEGEAAPSPSMVSLRLPDPAAVLTLGSLVTLTQDEFMQYRGLNLERPPKRTDGLQGLSPEEAAGVTRSSWRGIEIIATEAEDLQPLFSVRNAGWLGADVATSFRFPPRHHTGLRTSGVATSTLDATQGPGDGRAEGPKKEGDVGEEAEHGKYMWLFGDTLLGYANEDRRLSGAFFLHNSVAFLPVINVSDPHAKPLGPEDVVFAWNVSKGGCPVSIFVRGPPQDDECVHTQDYLWPISGIGVSYLETRAEKKGNVNGKRGRGDSSSEFDSSTAEGDVVSKVIVLAVRWAYVKSHTASVDLFDDNAFNFNILGTTVLVVDNPHAHPTQWEYRQRDLPGTDANLNWYSAMMHGDKNAELATGPEDMIYLFGVNNTEAVGTPPQQWQYETLSRLPVRSLVDLSFRDMEVWALTKGPPDEKAQATTDTDTRLTNTTWAPYPLFLHRHLKAAPLVFPVFSETSVRYSHSLGAYYGVVVDWLSSNVVLYLAEDLTEAWEPVVVYKIPPPFNDPAVYMTYAGKAHPELSREDELILTFMTNAPGDLEPLFETGAKDVYVPRFLRLKLERPAPKALNFAVVQENNSLGGTQTRIACGTGLEESHIAKPAA